MQGLGRQGCGPGDETARQAGTALEWALRGVSAHLRDLVGPVLGDAPHVQLMPSRIMC